MEEVMRRNKRKNRQTHHHLYPRGRGGTNQKENIVLLDEKMHNGYHALFGNSTLYEAIVWMIMLAKKNGYEKIEPEISRFY